MAPRKYIGQAARIVGLTIERLDHDDGWALASHLALSSLMALFPFLIFVAALAGFVGEGDLADDVADLMFDAWPEAVAAPIAGEVHKVLTEPRGGVLTVSVLITIYLAANGVEALRLALNRAYRIIDRRSFWWLRLESIVFVLIGAGATLVFAVLGVLGPLLWDLATGFLPALEPFGRSFVVIRYGLTTILLLLALALAHYWLPGERPKRFHLWPGILLTALLWLVATEVFAYYLARYANYRTTYAGLANVVTALFYLYLMSLILMIGAAFNGALADFFGRKDDEAPAG